MNVLNDDQMVPICQGLNHFLISVGCKENPSQQTDLNMNSIQHSNDQG